jgi:hypothetical protein
VRPDGGVDAVGPPTVSGSGVDGGAGGPPGVAVGPLVATGPGGGGGVVGPRAAVRLPAPW